MKNLITVFLILLAATGSVLAEDSGHDLTGRDVVDNGSIELISGILFTENNEWFINSNNTTFLIHMGRTGYELELEEGEFATIDGFVLDNQIAPITIRYNNTIIKFWNKDGLPSWAGNGDRKNAVENSKD